MSEFKNCPYCGEEIRVKAKKCKHCNEWLIDMPEAPYPSQPAQEPVRQQIVVNQENNESNGIGTAGFVLALVGLILSWIPGINLISFLGFIFSFIGLFGRPKGLAFAGFIISIIDVIIVFAIFDSILSILAALAL